MQANCLKEKCLLLLLLHHFVLAVYGCDQFCTQIKISLSFNFKSGPYQCVEHAEDF